MLVLVIASSTSVDAPGHTALSNSTSRAEPSTRVAANVTAPT